MSEEKGLFSWDWLNAIHDRVGGKVKWLVRTWRRYDAWLLKPLPRGAGRGRELLAPRDYPFFIPLLAAVLVFGVTIGPRPWNATWQTLLLFAVGLGLMIALHAAAARSVWLRYNLFAGYLALLLGLGGLLLCLSWLMPETSYDPEMHTLRVHVGPALAVLLTAMLAMSAPGAWWMTRRCGDETLPSALPRVELFQPKDRGDYMGDTPGLALLTIFFLPLLRYPMQLLLPPALAALLASPEWVFTWSVTAGVVSWLFLVVGILFERFMEILKTVGRLFFIGPQRMLSGLVIAIAIARWCDVHYVNYLFDTPKGTWTIFFYVIFAYAFCWFYGFWCEILLARRFIRLLHPQGAPVMQVDYNYTGSHGVTRVGNRGRSIALHGAGRLKVEGEYDASYRQEQGIDANDRALTFLTPAEMLADFRTQLEDRSWNRRSGRDPLPRVRDLQRAVFAFPGWNGAAVALCLLVPLYAGRALTAQPPELQIVNEAPSQKHLQPLLLGAVNMHEGDCTELGADTPRIAVAASGGGTRAAIYTAAVLRGLAERHEICRVVLMSGVSGGSAALAYFATHQSELQSSVFNEKAWNAFAEAMAKPYIQEVLYGASDSAAVFGTWYPRAGVCRETALPADDRPASWRPVRMTLGNLLAESFLCAMGGTAMGDVPFGLVFNTGLTGAYEPEVRDDTHRLPEQARRKRGDPSRTSDMAGGRLVIANFATPPSPPKWTFGAQDLRHIILTDTKIPVARAAALTANFPPVFADAALDVRTAKRDRRYWVTDGGTVENRGTVTLYLAIEDALPKAGKSRTAVWPDLHVLVVDASGAGGPYMEGIGFGALQGAGGQMGLALEAELVRDLLASYKGHGTLSIHELKMPAAMRDAIGTHWMMPNAVNVLGWERGQEQRLSKDEALGLVKTMFTRPPKDEGQAVSTVRQWASFEKPPDGALPSDPLPYAREWAALLETLDERANADTTARAD